MTEPGWGGNTCAQLLVWVLDHLGKLFAPTQEEITLHVLLPLGDGDSEPLKAKDRFRGQVDRPNLKS